MEKYINELIKKFEIIKNAGFVESKINEKSGSGVTLENLLNCGAGDLCYPDFNGIELKVIRKYNDASIDLFNCTPDGPHLNTTQWLTRNYGYPDKDFPQKKALKGEINSLVTNKIGLFYFFKLKISKKEKKVILEIYNHKGEKINNELYWDFKWIKQKLNTKMKFLAIIESTKFYSKGKYYFKYENIKIYKLKNFNAFIKLIEKGVINITFKTGYYKSGKYYGKFHDHGTSFRIKKENINLLYDNIQIS